MFGYVKANKPEMKVREYDFYRGTYCGLCHAMGKCTGQCSRMTLSYDFVFLALTRLAVLNESFTFSKRTCIAHPLTKKAYMTDNQTLDYCASAAALLNYHKVKDDLNDEKSLKKLRAICILPFVTYGRKKAIKKGYTDLDKSISDGLLRLSEIEKKKMPSVDEPARVFGQILADIISYGLDGNNEKICRALGASVGKWIYIADALDDWDEDAKNGRYNPFILLYGNEKPTKEVFDSIDIALKNELLAAEGAYDLIDVENNDLRNILENILFLGLPAKIKEIGERITPENTERITDK